MEQASSPALGGFAQVIASREGPRVSATLEPPKIAAIDFHFFYSNFQALRSINIAIPPGLVTALIGPSGCGKSTLLRAINRLHDRTPGARGEGQLLLDGTDIYGPGSDPVLLRRRVGMVFQRPNPFSMSIFDNVAYGLHLLGGSSRAQIREQVERALRQAALWDEVKHKLKAPGTALSGGQQQRLCIARAVAPAPDVVLMDEPCSALDPIATGKIEELIHSLRGIYTIIIVTHNMQQAARVSDFTGFMLMDATSRAGTLIEFSPTAELFTRPRDKRTEDYITGRFG
jgi:phosphate transport system ATP-binding protein